MERDRQTDRQRQRDRDRESGMEGGGIERDGDKARDS